MQLNRFIMLCVFLACCSSNFGFVNKVDFDVSMQPQSYPGMFERKGAHERYIFFRNLYNANFVSQAALGAQKRIPTIFHYIWLGGKVPDVYTPFRESWLEMHPDWIFIFWTDSVENINFGEYVFTSFEEVERFLASSPPPGTRIVVGVSALKYDNKVFFDRSSNFGERSDILRWELVYRFGGVYLDVDYECLRPLDELHYLYDFYTALQPLDTELVQLGAALFGACPGHPIMKECIDGIRNNQQIPQIVSRTGPVHFTYALMRSAYQGNFINQVFPASYFYPCFYEQRGMPQEAWRKPESYAIHHWAGSWLKPEGWLKKQK